ncbi:MAG: hypothetical protein HC806_07665 [Anaerolineae bacterium]|nr:hypothetical protein [Anaerolineae bacterium]
MGHALDKHFPNDPLVGEEDSSSLREEANGETLERITHFVGQYTDGATPNAVCLWIDRGSAESGTRYWTVDPIDGTKGFLRGDQYAVALALVENGQVQVGVLGCPNLNIQYLIGDDETAFKPGHGSIVVAVRGQGTWAASLEGENFTRLSVSPRVNPIQARLLKSVEAAHTNTGKIGELVTLLNVQADPVGMDSQAKYAVLAAGRGDVLVRLISSKAPDYKEKYGIRGWLDCDRRSRGQDNGLARQNPRFHHRTDARAQPRSLGNKWGVASNVCNGSGKGGGVGISNSQYPISCPVPINWHFSSASWRCSPLIWWRTACLRTSHTWRMRSLTSGRQISWRRGR